MPGLTHKTTRRALPKAGISVRKARVSDVPQIIELARKRDGAKKNWSPARRSGFTLQLRHIVSQQGHHKCWVAVDADRAIVGYAFASQTYSTIDDGVWMHVTELFVVAKMRSAGVGQRLMRTIKQASTKGKTCGLWLVVHPNNVDAKRFYRRHKLSMRTMQSCAWVG